MFVHKHKPGSPVQATVFTDSAHLFSSGRLQETPLAEVVKALEHSEAFPIASHLSWPLINSGPLP